MDDGISNKTCPHCAAHGNGGAGGKTSGGIADGHPHMACKSDSSCGKSCCAKASSCCSAAKTSKSFFGEGVKLWLSALSIVLSFAIWQFGLYWPFLPYSDPSWIAVVFCAYPIYKSAFHYLFKERKITSALLISTAMTAAFGLQILSFMDFHSEGLCSESYILVVAEIAFLMQLGEWLEERTVKKSRSGIESLSSMMPRTAIVKEGSALREVPVGEIKKGDTVCVNPDTMIPVDGAILYGSTSVDESTMTGEGIPVDKSSGDKVLGGTLNTWGRIEVRAQKTADESALSRLVKIVEEAEGKKAPISRVADRWASRIVPTAIVASMAVFLGAHYLLGVDWIDSLVRGVTILVVFCPCAFVLATPTAVAAGLGNAAKRGILVKSGAALEKMAEIDSVFFDKTGTLTKGKVSVDEVFCTGVYDDELLHYAASAESFSSHPIAHAIVRFSRSKVGLAEPSQMRSLTGAGVEALVDGAKIEVLKFDESDASLKPCANFAKAAFAKGKTVVCVKKNGVAMGALSLSDTAREYSFETVDSLEKSGYSCAMLSGDNVYAARAAAESLGVKKVFAPLKPEEKQALIREFQARGKKICFVGDGVNDAPALALADVSIAVADLKNDVAMETAEVSLVGGDLRKIPAILSFSKSVMRTIRGNIVFSICFNFCAVILAALGLLSPVGGAVLHNASSVIVVLNSARLLKKK